MLFTGSVRSKPNERPRSHSPVCGRPRSGKCPSPEPGKWYAARARNESAAELTDRFVAMMEAARRSSSVTQGDRVRRLYETSVRRFPAIFCWPPGTATDAAIEGLRTAASLVLPMTALSEAWKDVLSTDVHASLTDCHGHRRSQRAHPCGPMPPSLAT